MAQAQSRKRISPAARVIIADDNDLARAGLQAILSSIPGLELAGEATNGRAAVELCRTLQPDLALLDVRMPDMDGLAAARAIRMEAPATRVIMVTIHDNLDYLLEAMRAGASGYVLKEASREELLTAVRRVLAGEQLLNAGESKRMLQRMASDDPENSTAVKLLTLREIEVLRLVADGRTNQYIATTLHISRGTVKVHVEHILAKLDVSDRTEAAVYASQLGLLKA